jgi:hypothetical protein
VVDRGRRLCKYVRWSSVGLYGPSSASFGDNSYGPKDPMGMLWCEAV